MFQENLFDDFKVSTPQEWKERINKDLKNSDFESIRTHTPNGFSIEPVYHRNTAEIKDQPFKATAKWDIVQEMFVEDAKNSNEEALQHLNRGATSLLFYVYANVNLEQLLKNIHIEYIRVNFVVEGDVFLLLNGLKSLIKSRGIKETAIAGSVNIDCLESIARTGKWRISKDEDLKVIKRLNEELPKNMAGLCLNVNLFANAGATHRQQLGIALAMAYEYHHSLQIENPRSFWINFAIGSDYFGEIAKLRAFRRLWQQLHKELDLQVPEVFIYAETALRNKTIKDAYNNMIRSSSEAMAAAIGGANEISVKGFNHTFKEPDAFGERIAKNQQAIIQYESHLNEVLDISKGSYFIEDITEKLAAQGWAFFKEIEELGGYIKALENGWLQAQIENSAQAEQKLFDEKSMVLIGANKHVHLHENIGEIIKYGMFAAHGKEETEFRKVQAKRLSENLEKADLK